MGKSGIFFVRKIGYKWSSHPAYLKGNSDKEWLDINNLLACFSSRKKKAIILYKEFMDIDLDDEVGELFSKIIKARYLVIAILLK